MRTAAIDMPLHQGAAPKPPMRLLRVVQSRFPAPGAAPPRTSSSIAIVSSWSGRRESVLRIRTTTASAQPGTSRRCPQRHQPPPSHIEQLPPPPPTRPPHGARHQLADKLLLNLNFLDRREAIPDLNTARTLVQWNFSDQGRSLGRSRWVLVGREVEGEDERIRQPSLVVTTGRMAGSASPRAQMQSVNFPVARDAAGDRSRPRHR